MIIVAGHLRVRPEQRVRAIELSRPAVAAARIAAGCLDFAVSADPIDADRINVFERWADRGALDRFRADGPDGELGALIVEAFVDEFDV